MRPHDHAVLVPASRADGGQPAPQQRILTITLSPALDVYAEVPVVVADHKLHCAHTVRTPGGGGINVARAINRLGGTATALFPYGGSTGAVLCALLRDEAVPTIAVPIEGTTREDFAARETGTGHEYRFVLPGPVLRPEELRRCVAEALQRTGRDDYVVVSGSVPGGVALADVEGLVVRLRDLGARVVVDTSGPALAAVARAGVHLLKPSLNELSQHAGRPLGSPDEIVAAAEALRASGPNHAVLVSLGAGGAVLVVDGRPPAAIAAPPLRVISAVGAGDSLLGALVLSLAQGADLLEAARLGVAAGSAATISTGHHLCDPHDVRALMAEMAPIQADEGEPAARSERASAASVAVGAPAG